MHARLTLFQPDYPARQFLLSRDERYVIGRDDACTIQVDDRRLSRRHARIEFESGQWRLIDLCSKNGTMIAGRAITQCNLDDDTWFEIGSLLGCFDHVSSDFVAEEEMRITERWQTSVHLSRTLRPAGELDDVLDKVLQSFIELADAERGFIVLGQEHRAPIGDRFRGSQTVLKKTMSEGRPIVCSDTRHDDLLGQQASIVSGGISALVSMPLKVGEQVQGLIYVDSREPGKQFTELDLEILEALAHHASMVIGVSRLRDDIVDLSAMLPDELDRDTPANDALIDKLQELLPQIERPETSKVALGGADS